MVDVNQACRLVSGECQERGAAVMSSPGDQISPEIPAECCLELPDQAHSESQDAGLISFESYQSSLREIPDAVSSLSQGVGTSHPEQILEQWLIILGVSVVRKNQVQICYLLCCANCIE